MVTPPTCGHVTTVIQGVRLTSPGRGRGRGRLEAQKILTNASQADAVDVQHLQEELRRARMLTWYRNRYIEKKNKDPEFLLQKRERERLARQDPGYLDRIKKWEMDNAESIKAYKQEWARQRRLNETPEEREARLVVQRERERAYYAANREKVLAKEKARRERKRRERNAEVNRQSEQVLP